MKHIVVTVVLFSFVAMSGCLHDGNADATAAVLLTEISKGQNSGIANQRFEVIRDDNAFTQLWLDHSEGMSVAPVQPTVDFGQDMLIAAFLGVQSTGGYSIEVTGAEEVAESIMVTLKGSLPGTGCVVTAAFSKPYHFVTIPKSPKPIAFTTSIERVNCS